MEVLICEGAGLVDGFVLFVEVVVQVGSCEVRLVPGGFVSEDGFEGGGVIVGTSPGFIIVVMPAPFSLMKLSLVVSILFILAVWPFLAVLQRRQQ